MINSKVMPSEYLMLSYNFLIGCLWIRFAPLFQSVQNCISATFNSAEEAMRITLANKHARLTQNLSWTS